MRLTRSLIHSLTRSLTHIARVDLCLLCAPETPGGASSRPPSEQSPAAAATASSEAKTHTLTIPAQFVGNAVATHWYQFLHSAQVPEDACIRCALTCRLRSMFVYLFLCLRVNCMC